MDEPSHYGETLHDLLGMITTRLRGVDGPKKQLWTLTGEGFNAAWEILEKRHNADGEPIGLDIHITRGSVLENPYLDEGSKDRFRRQYEGTEKEQQALHGGFAAATGLVYSDFTRDARVIDAAAAERRVDDEWRIYGYDAGWNDPRVLLEIGQTPYDQLVVLDSFHRSGSHVEDAVAWLEENDKPDGTIFAEHEPSDIDKFKRAGYTVKKAEKSIDAGIDEVRRRLRNDGNAEVREKDKSFLVWSTWSGGKRERIQRRRREGDDESEADGMPDERVGLLVSDRCQDLIREFLGYKEDHVGTSQAADHELDSLRYAVMGVNGGRGKGGSGVW